MIIAALVVASSLILVLGRSVLTERGFAIAGFAFSAVVAAWLLMKRGCGVIPVHFSTSRAQTEQVEAIIEGTPLDEIKFEYAPVPPPPPRPPAQSHGRTA